MLTKEKKRGFSFIEIILVIIILSALTTMIIPRLRGRTEEAKRTIARTDILVNIPTALKLYELDNGRYPSTEQGLNALIEKPSIPPFCENWHGPYIERKALLDPWGREYIYKYPGEHGKEYDLYSLGRDEENDEDNINNWD